MTFVAKFQNEIYGTPTFQMGLVFSEKEEFCGDLRLCCKTRLYRIPC